MAFWLPGPYQREKKEEGGRKELFNPFIPELEIRVEETRVCAFTFNIKMAAEEGGFKFTQMPPPAIKKDVMEFLDKWGFSDKLKFQSFSFNNHFQPYLKESFAQDFFKSPTVNNVLQTISGGGQLMPLALGTIRVLEGVLIHAVGSSEGDRWCAGGGGALLCAQHGLLRRPVEEWGGQGERQHCQVF